MKLATRVSRLGTETAFDVLAEVVRLRAEGRDVISFAIGEPDFDTPEHIKDAAKRALDENHTHYNPSNGLLEFRQAIAEDTMKMRPGFECTPDEVVVTPGAKPIIFHTILAVVEEGSEVVYPSPGFPIYESMINFVGAKAVPYPLVEERGFSLDPDDLAGRVSDRTSLIIINSPQNPTGGVLERPVLEAIAEIAKKHDCWVLSDEVYNRMVWDGQFQSIAQVDGMKERTVILDGCSKTYAMTGWRIGWGVMPKELAPVISRLITNSDSCTCTFSQVASVDALRGPEQPVKKMLDEFRARRELVVEGLNSIEGVSCVKPAGAFYAFPNVTGACRALGFADAKDLASYLLHEAGVAVLGRSCFGAPLPGEKEQYVRLSYATSREQIKEGLARMKEAIENPKR
ncbi:MAG: pyridoxal phosphate-dependent aminotransferase [Deltaproteobacteria bacterium]|nr:MAG: pyridoxal phosphate-dependent aminotransferase [Deltaproteobacteria bacterium]